MFLPSDVVNRFWVYHSSTDQYEFPIAGTEARRGLEHEHGMSGDQLAVDYAEGEDGDI